MLRAGEVVHHPLVDPQRGGRQQTVRLRLDHAPAPQWGVRGNGAPVWIGKDRQCEAERRCCGPTVAAQARDARAHLGSRTEQQHVALERRQSEGVDDALEGVRVRGRPVVGGRPTGARRLQARGDAIELVAERALILRRPVGHSVTVGASYVPAEDTCSGLSTPSTRTRTKYVPATTPAIGNSMEPVATLRFLAGNV